MIEHAVGVVSLDRFAEISHMDHDEMGSLLLDTMAENNKLRELVRDYEHCSMHADCGRCEYDGTTSTHCPLSPCFPDIDELHGLGVEVGE